MSYFRIQLLCNCQRAPSVFLWLFCYSCFFDNYIFYNIYDYCNFMFTANLHISKQTVWMFSKYEEKQMQAINCFIISRVWRKNWTTCSISFKYSITILSLFEAKLKYLNINPHIEIIVINVNKPDFISSNKFESVNGPLEKVQKQKPVNLAVMFYVSAFLQTWLT